MDFDNGVLTINKQMQLHQDKDMKAYQLVSTKNSKARTIITAAPFVMERLKHRKVEQTKEWLLAGPLWQQSGLVFTDATGNHITKPTLYRAFKRATASIGRPDARFYDLRHSYTVATLRSGDDIKTVQGEFRSSHSHLYTGCLRPCYNADERSQCSPYRKTVSMG